MKLAPGQTFGRYQIEKFIGQGGMGVVFRALDTLLERPVALKVILPAHAQDPEALPRFMREAKLAAKLTHPNTVHLYDLGEVEGMPFMAMELIDGRSLFSFMTNTADPVAPDRKLRWMLGVARGLAAAHERGLIHRDVKPANIMVSLADDLAKIVDFGLAKRIETTPVLRKTFRTETGFVVGTPAYMAPEAIGGGDPDERSDQFSWALTAHALVAGKNPRANDPLLERPIPMLSDLHPEVPRRAALVMIRALSNDPAMRFRSMTELADALAEAMLVGTLAPPPVMSPFSMEPGSIPPIVPKRVVQAMAAVQPARNPAESEEDLRKRFAQRVPLHDFARPAAQTPAPMAARVPVVPPAPAPERVVVTPPDSLEARADRRRAVEESARAAAKRMRYVDQNKFSVAKAGYTAYKQEHALRGTPLAAQLAEERWTFTRFRPACPFPALRLASFRADGSVAFALSARETDEEALVLSGDAWNAFALADVKLGYIECARILSDGRIAIGGRGGLTAVATFGGKVEHWEIRGKVGNAVVDMRSTGDGALFRASFTAVDARMIDGELELVFAGQVRGAAIAAVGSQGRLTQHVSNRVGPISAVSCGKVIMTAGQELGIVTEEGIEAAGNADGARMFVSLDENSALAVGKSGFVYFNPLNAATWPELVADFKRPITAAVATRTEVYAVDEGGSVLRRTASWTWMQVPGGKSRAVDPIAMWAGPGRIRIVCADGAIVDGRRH